ncbi:MAG TPA: outer membrane lipoprotein chaperone LolA [Gammaproteobacteria bacterium]|nr:outer membrane lipoprotein chaperone LolA [Gammaproteobacteria bacterium]
MDSEKFSLRLYLAIASLSFLGIGVVLPFGHASSQARNDSEAAPGPVEPAAASGPVEFLERYIAEVDDLTANFAQEVFDVDGALIEEESSTGRFSLLRPNRFVWHYDPPYELIVIADGESLWMYDVELETATKAPLSDLATSPAMLLSGEGTVSEGFSVRDLPSDDALHWIELLPIEDDSEFQSAKIGFRDGIPEVLDLVDALSQRQRIEFRDVETNTGLRRRDFEFDPPRGVDIVGDDEGR